MDLSGYPVPDHNFKNYYACRELSDAESPLLRTHINWGDFELVWRANEQPRCDFFYQEAWGEVNFLGYRSLVQAACLEMMRLAEQGQFPQAVALARDVGRMIERLESSPTAILHAVNLTHARQLASTIADLNSAYPGRGFEQLGPELASLAGVLEKGFGQCVSAERAKMAAQFERITSGDLSGPVQSHDFGLASDLQRYQAALAYLETSQEVESAFSAGDRARVVAALESLKGRNSMAAIVTPSWDKFWQRHEEAMRELGSTL